MFFVLIILISGCRSGEKKKESIMLLHYFTDNFAKGFEDFTKEVNKKSKDINLISTPMEHEEFKVKIRVQLEIKKIMKIFFLNCREKSVSKN